MKSDSNLMDLPFLSPLHSVVFLGSGSHAPLLVQIDILEPMSVYPGKEHPNVTLLPAIAESSL